jgi:hypothetical protein
MCRRADGASAGETPSVAGTPASCEASSDRSVPRRRFLAGVAATASATLAGCGGRLPDGVATVDATLRRDDATLTWAYPASAVEDDEDSDGIGYAAVGVGAVDRAPSVDRALPGLTFALNSTVGTIHAGAGFQEYRADWFRFRIGVPRSYDHVSGFQALVQPNQWPDLRVAYGYEGAVRELAVTAPEVDTDGTITIEGQFRSADATLPRQLYCGFEVQASQPGLAGRTVVADGRATLDVSTLDLPDGVVLQ